MSLFVEKKTDDDEFFQLNIEKNTFTAYKLGNPLLAEKEGKKIRVHSLILLVFYGEDVELLNVDKFSPTENFFYLAPVVDGFLEVKFKVKNYKTPKTVKLKFTAKANHWPIEIKLARDFKKNKSKDSDKGLLYFALDWEEYKRNLIEFKVKYKHLRYFVYRDDVDQVEERADGAKTPMFVRAKDVLESDPESNLRLDPVFMARVHLRVFNWVEFKRLPLELYISTEQISEIFSFIEVMEGKISVVPSLKKQEKEILTSKNYYLNLKLLLSYNPSVLEKIFDSNTISQTKLPLILEVLKAQRKIIEGQNLLKEEDYLSMAIEALKFHQEKLNQSHN